MAILKCKMCGGDLTIQDSMTVAECEYCGTTQTLPKLVSDDIANLYDRANHFRRNNEFDKAEGIYERILSQTPEDSEAYWSLVLCRYGIEYVEDPATRKRVPTVNRTQYTSVFDDENYKSAIAHADAIQRRVYEEEAAAINEIQKGILAISQKEEPFDVFICYKETDRNGRRTPDSVLATDLYHQLTNEGFKVFFARITLEDKLGSAYEPYIFAALNSAKVMVVLGTKPEYFNAVWVKNEWSRYLALVNKSGGKKVLIPAYRDMDPYDLPEEFSHLQAQDMSKLGFMQDLIRGIKKITGSDKPKAQTQVVSTVAGASDVAPLLKRMFMYLEDGEWDKANEYAERVLDKNPENAEAYVGKLMADIRVRRRETLKDQAQPFDNNRNYQKAVRFANAALKNELTGCIRYINDRNAETKRKQEEERRRLEKERREEEQRREEERRKNAYDEAISIMNNASTEDDYKRAENSFYSASGYKDADALAKKCNESAETCRKDSILCKAKEKMQNDTLESCFAARDELKSISGWKDANDQIAVCETKISELTSKKEEEERIAAKKKKKLLITISSIVAAGIVIVAASVIVLNSVIIPNIKYNTALELFNAEKYEEALPAFEELNGFNDSNDKIKECKIFIGVEYHVLDNGTVEVIGLRDSSIDAPVLLSVYNGYPVTSIGKNAFKNRSGLTTITIPGSVTSIGNSAFEGCNRLTTVTIPDSVTSIGNSVFEGCNRLTTVTIPDSVTSIGKNVFKGCNSLTTVTIPNTVTSISENMFENCSNLTTVTIPDSVTSISKNAFGGCSRLSNVTIPDSVTIIGDSSFYYCVNLTSITIPSSVTKIGNLAFNTCSNLASVIISNSVSSIGERAFSKCDKLTSVVIPDSITSIGYWSFDDSITIYGHKGSTAEKYAKEHNCTFHETNT